MQLPLLTKSYEWQANYHDTQTSHSKQMFSAVSLFTQSLISSNNTGLEYVLYPQFHNTDNSTDCLLSQKIHASATKVTYCKALFVIEEQS